MKQYAMTADRAREIFDYDPLTGVVRWKKGPHAGREAGHFHAARGYRTLWADGEAFLAHRLIWLIVFGEWPALSIDHINGVKTDNRLRNLRLAGYRLNAENKHCAQANNKLGLFGVYLCKSTNRFRARIRVNGKEISLGRHDTPDLAHAAYVAAKRKYHEGCSI